MSSEEIERKLREHIADQKATIKELRSDLEWARKQMEHYSSEMYKYKEQVIDFKTKWKYNKPS